jgi:hypothetical protein
MSFVIFDLNVSPEQYQKWYGGAARAVQVTARDGRRIQFPAKILQPFVTHSGIRGTFAIYFDADNKYQDIKRLQ